MAYPLTIDTLPEFPEFQDGPPNFALAAHQNEVRARLRAMEPRVGDMARGIGAARGWVSQPVTLVAGTREVLVGSISKASIGSTKFSKLGGPFTVACASIAGLTAGQGRIDVLTIDTAGTFAWTTGVAAAYGSVVAPAYPAGKMALAEVKHRYGSNYVTNTDDGTNSFITDVRPLLTEYSATAPSVRAISGNTTLAVTDDIVLVTTGGSTITVTLPAVAGLARLFPLIIKKVDVGVGTVVIDPNAAETVDGSPNKTLSGQWATTALWPDGTNWITEAGAAGGDLTGAYPAPTVAQVSGAFAFKNPIAPTALAAQQDNWNPTGLSTTNTIEASASVASVDITGLAGGYDGRVVLLANVGASNNLVLKNESASSTATNRFALTADITLAPNALVFLKYSAALSRWIAVAGGGGGGGGGNYQTFKNAGVAVTQRASLDVRGTGFAFSDDGTNTIITLGQTPQGQTLGSGNVTLTTGDVSTTSTSFVDATGVTSTITTVGGDVLVGLQDSTLASVGSNMGLDVMRDGSSLGTSVNKLGYQASTNATVGSVFINYLDRAPTAGSHTYKVQFKSASGTVTLKADGTNYALYYFVRELPLTSLVGSGGGSPLGSGSVVINTTGFSTTSTSFVDLTGASITIPTTGGDVLMTSTLAFQNTAPGNRSRADFAVDGTRLGGTEGMISVSASGSGTLESGTLAWTARGLATGSHTFKVQVAVSGGTLTVREGTDFEFTFQAHELPVTNTLVQAGAALGSGNVVLNSANVTTTSTSFMDLTGASITTTLQGGAALIGFIAFSGNSGANNNIYDIDRDGSRLGGQNFTIAERGTNPIPVSFTFHDPSPAVGNHTYKMQWRVTAGTGTTYANATDEKTYFWLREQPLTTLGGIVGTGAVLGSGNVTLSSGDVTTTSTSYTDLTGVTSTLITVGGPVLIRSQMVSLNSGSNVNFFDLLKDAVSLSGAPDGVARFISTNHFPLTFNHTDPSPTAASHTYKAQWKVQAGTGTVSADGTNRKAFYDVRELPLTTGGPRSPITGHLAGATLATGVTNYAAPGLTTFDATEANREGLIPFTGLLRNFRVRTSTAQSAGGTLVFTLRINGVDTAVTFSIGAGAVAGTYGDTTNTVAVSGGDRFSWKVTNNGSGTSAAVGPLSMELAG